jgi:hypothetical protein
MNKNGLRGLLVTAKTHEATILAGLREVRPGLGMNGPMSRFSRAASTSRRCARCIGWSPSAGSIELSKGRYMNAATNEQAGSHQ